MSTQYESEAMAWTDYVSEIRGIECKTAPASELIPGTSEALSGLTIREETES